ncbi:Protein MIZU-KUSSEI 1 [Dichanthelium oligosanthes]|uniref:Protein MIZU-KUSSEI 1 n=1 Tax=Dichanthelium oligosanthes TaxID=888268 RepID=A0A1E5VE17_9POAL|nr:Protein MIZU-KUSSEI 1 [Dichanthelium oligosanthes]
MAYIDAGAAADDPDRCRTRLVASLSSLGTDHDDAVCKKPILRQAMPSPARSAGHALEEPPKRRAPGRRSRPVRMFQSMCRSLPLINPRCGRQLQPGACRIASPARLTQSDSFLSQLLGSPASAASSSSHRLTGTLFGYRDGRISLSLQDNARCQPTFVVELALPTHALLRELGTHAGARIVLESEKHAAEQGDGAGHGHGVGSASFKRNDDDGWVLEEPMWTMFCNGKRVGYAVRREPTEEDIAVLETLWAVTMGGGVLPGRSDVDGPDGEMAYMRGSFEHTVGSRDSESLYMVAPPGGDAPELAIFFVRL